MKRVVLDAEWPIDGRQLIWCAVTKDYDTGEVKRWLTPEGLNEYLTGAQIIGQNVIAADVPKLNQLWKTSIRLSQLVDTLVLSRLLNPNRQGGHSLDAWGQRLGRPKIDFSDYNLEHSTLEECVDYCEGDVETTALLYTALLKEQEKYQHSEDAILLEHQCQAVVAAQERNGFKLDAPFATSLLATLKDRMSAIEEELQEVFPPIVTERYSEKTGKRLKDDVEVFNPGSRQQIGRRLISLGWEPKKFTPSGQPQIDEGVLAKVDIAQAKPIADYLMIQKRVGQIESWLENLQSDGRVHGKVNTIGAATHRASHFSPNMAQIVSMKADKDGNPVWGHDGGYGAEMRSCWIVEPGNVLVGCDAEGVQLRGLAHYMQDPDYIEAVANGRKEDGTDIHTVNTKAFGFHLRNSGKTGIYAFLFGAQGGKMYTIAEDDARSAGKPFEYLKSDHKKRKYGDALIQRFLQKTPALKQLREKLARMVQRNKMLPGLDGRKLLVDQERLALVTLLQAFEAIIMKKAMVLLAQKAKRAGIEYKQVAWVHDEWQLEVAAEFGDVLGQMAADCIKEAGEFYGSRCPLSGSYSVGKSWCETH